MTIMLDNFTGTKGWRNLFFWDLYFNEHYQITYLSANVCFSNTSRNYLYIFVTYLSSLKFASTGSYVFDKQLFKKCLEKLFFS